MSSSNDFKAEEFHRVAGSRASMGACAVALLAAFAQVTMLEAAITPSSSSLSATSLADVEPLDQDPVTGSDGTPDGSLTDLSVLAVSTDGSPPGLSEFVATSASATYSGNNTITVEMYGSRTGTDPNLGAPGGSYQSIAAYRLPFENLDAGTTITVAWDLDWVRPSEGTTSPHGIALRRGFDADSRGLAIPFNALEGPASGMETFELTGTGSGLFDLYTLEIDLYMVGMTTDLAPAESWDAVFVITTPPITTIGGQELLGDFNDDGAVDAADYVVWRKNDGGTTALPNDDDLGTPIRAEHYTLWRAHFGEMPTTGIGSGGAIPEPGTFVLTAAGLLLLGACRPRQVERITR
jgi:hypothetical protein